MNAGEWFGSTAVDGDPTPAHGVDRPVVDPPEALPPVVRLPSWIDPTAPTHWLHPCEFRPGDVLLARNEDDVVRDLCWIRDEDGAWHLRVTTRSGGFVFDEWEATGGLTWHVRGDRSDLRRAS